MPVSTRCCCEPSARMTKSSSQHRSGCRRSPENAIWPPLGEYAGPKLLVGHGVVASLVTAVPLARMTSMLDCGRQQLSANAMWLPSGDQAGWYASSRGAVNGCACVPSMRATQTWAMIPLNPNRVKVIRRPSGDTFGSKLLVSVGACSKKITKCRCVPSERMIQIAHRSKFGRQRVNTMCSPSGEQEAGSVGRPGGPLCRDSLRLVGELGESRAVGVHRVDLVGHEVPEGDPAGGRRAGGHRRRRCDRQAGGRERGGHCQGPERGYCSSHVGSP